MEFLKISIMISYTVREMIPRVLQALSAVGINSMVQ